MKSENIHVGDFLKKKLNNYNQKISINEVDTLAVGSPPVSFLLTRYTNKNWSQSITNYFPLTQLKAKLDIYGWTKRSITDCKLPMGYRLQGVKYS